MKINSKDKENIILRLKNEPLKTYPLNYFRSWDRNIVKLYGTFVRNKLQELYSEQLNSKGKVLTESNKYHPINYLDTHYTAFAIIVNYLNGTIKSSANINELMASRQLNFKEDRSNWEEETNNAIKLIDICSKFIFKENKYTSVYGDIMNAIIRTNKKGYESEKLMKEFITEVFPGSCNFIMGGHGEEDDMYGGVDIRFEYSDNEYTLQQKRCKSIHKGNKYYFVSGVGGIKKYKVDYLGFHTKNNELFLFKNNEHVVIKEYEGFYKKDGKKYEIPKELFVNKKVI
jgi:hypothetical protein